MWQQSFLEVVAGLCSTEQFRQSRNHNKKVKVKVKAVYS